MKKEKRKSGEEVRRERRDLSLHGLGLFIVLDTAARKGNETARDKQTNKQTNEDRNKIVGKAPAPAERVWCLALTLCAPNSLMKPRHCDIPSKRSDT